jgi:hypothetical protein
MFIFVTETVGDHHYLHFPEIKFCKKFKCVNEYIMGGGGIVKVKINDPPPLPPLLAVVVGLYVDKNLHIITYHL